MKLLLYVVALSLSLWQAAPAYAGYNEPVHLPQTPAYSGDVVKPAGSGTMTIQPNAVTAGKMSAGAAVGNLGYTPVDIAGSKAMTGPLAIVNFNAGPAPTFADFNNTTTPQTGTTMISLVQSSGSTNYRYYQPMLYLERYDNTTDSTQYSSWGNAQLAPMLTLNESVGPNSVNNPNPLAVHVRNYNTAVAQNGNPNLNVNAITAASFFADTAAPGSTLNEDAFAINIIASQGQGTTGYVNNLVGAECDVGGIIDATGVPGQGGVNHSCYWAQAAGFNNSTNKATLQSAAFMVTAAYPGGGWNFGTFAYSNFAQWAIYAYNTLNAPGANGIYVHNTYGAPTSLVADFGGATSNSFFKITGDGAVGIGNGNGAAVVVNNPATINAPVVITAAAASATTGAINLTNASADVELGSLSATGTPLIDFHSSGSANDYDARLIATGGTSGTAGAGNLTFKGNAFVLNATLQLGSAYTATACTNAGYTTLQTSDGTTRKVMICN